MLVLSRKVSRQILVGSDISITVVKIEGHHVRLGIQAPADVSILRSEPDVVAAEPRERPVKRPRAIGM